MAISAHSMGAALCRAFLQYQDVPKLSGYSLNQYIEFAISWQGRDLQGEEIGDIFMAASEVFEKTSQIVNGKIDTPMLHGNGLKVRVQYPYPFSWYVIGRKPNGRFARLLAITDIARCLDLNNSTAEIRRLLQKSNDPSSYPYRLWRALALYVERQRREKSYAKLVSERAKREQDFR